MTTTVVEVLKHVSKSYDIFLFRVVCELRATVVKMLYVRFRRHDSCCGHDVSKSHTTVIRKNRTVLIGPNNPRTETAGL